MECMCRITINIRPTNSVVCERIIHVDLLTFVSHMVTVDPIIIMKYIETGMAVTEEAY